MMVKRLVKRGRQYVEEYVDLGPGRAVLNHGRPVRSLADRSSAVRNSGRKQLKLGAGRA